MSGSYPEDCLSQEQEPAFEDEDDTYYQCPERFIPNNIHSFINQYFYEKKFNSCIEYEKRNTKYIDGCIEYEKWFAYWESVLKPRR